MKTETYIYGPDIHTHYLASYVICTHHFHGHLGLLLGVSSPGGAHDGGVKNKSAFTFKLKSKPAKYRRHKTSC